MGLIKPNNYSKEELKFDIVGKAISNPARSRIIDLLLICNTVRNTDLSNYLNLSPAMVTKHLDYMKRAKVIEVEYEIHYDLLRLNFKTLEFYSEEVEKWKNRMQRNKLNFDK